jgi:hypothetical protein
MYIGDLTNKDKVYEGVGLSKRLEWLKNLVMGLLFSSASTIAQDPSADPYIAAVLSDMMVHLKYTINIYEYFCV